MDHQFQARPRVRAAIAAAAVCLSLGGVVLANHGPGASGGGSSTVSGETLKPGRVEFSLREDFSKFEHFDAFAASQRAAASGDFDALNHGFLTTFDAAYGVIEDFQISGSIGYFAGDDFISAEDTGGGVIDLATVNPHGLTDLTLMGKYRFLSGKPGNVAVIGGVVIPVGRDDVRLSNGERLSPTDQPSTGRWGLPIGLGYSRFLTSKVTVDASAVYTYRFERDDFKVGDRFDAGVAVAYRITESIQSFPQFSVFTELNNVWLQKDQESGASNPNSGGNTLYVTPGFRMRFDKRSTLTVAPSFPILQDLNGDQGEVEFKVAIAFTYSM